METLEQEAPAKEIKKATPKKPNLPEPSKNQIEFEDMLEFEKEIEWIAVDSKRNRHHTEEPLQLMVYYKTDEDSKKKSGRITFSYFLTQKFGTEKKFKFGALKGKILFQVTDKEGLSGGISKTKYSKLCVTSLGITELIYEKYNLKQGSSSVRFQLKDLGNDFYLLDEIIK